MKFGVILDSHIEKWDLIRYAEELGYTRAGAGDSQMIWSDCYAVLTLAAVNTTRISLGTGVAIPGTRIAPVTAHSIATLNQLAPGRVFCGIGTGNTAMRVMGQEPMPVREFREYVRVVRALLDGHAVDYTYRGKTREIQFLHRDRRFINLEHRIPIYVAANGPKALEVAAEYGDGWITSGGDVIAIRQNLAGIRSAASKMGRRLPADFVTTSVIGICVMRPGERLSDDRVVNETGAVVTLLLHVAYEIWEQLGRREEFVPPYFRDMWDEYVKRVAGFEAKSRFRQIHDGHLTFLQEEERRFVTPEAIKATCLTGEPDEIIERIRELENAGIQEIALMSPADYQRKVYRDVAELVLPAFR
jgi:alkanesulfonate monooxygenase SsuD/methylene tetrahydromethanopterin reductase-like flavin-dependent oxidoreductase (luciferase family)